MERGTYVSASGGWLQLSKLDIVNNNLANVNTPGFKRQYLVSKERSFSETLASKMQLNDPFAEGDHARTPGTVAQETFTDFTPGPVKATGNPLDVALNHANDFFVINTPTGPQYTRAGSFTLDVEGSLVTQDGFQVQGDGGALTVSGASAEISAGGVVTAGGQQIGRLQIVRFSDPSVLERVGATRFKLRDGQGTAEEVEADLAPSALEMSNVSAVGSVLELMAANRAFDMYSKSARTIDEMNQTSIREVGREGR